MNQNDELAGKRLRNMAMLGSMLAQAEKEQVDQAHSKKTYDKELEQASIQVAAAMHCIEVAIIELEKIPGSSGWLLLFMLRTDVIRFDNMSKELRTKKGNKNG